MCCSTRLLDTTYNAEAGLNDKLMRGVVSAIRKVKGRKTGSTSSKAGKEDVGVAAGATGAAAEKSADERTAEGRTSSNTVAKAPKTKTNKKAASSRGKAKGAPKPVAKERSAVEQQVVALETWRFRESGRFSEKKDPFESFGSPPGRF